MADVLLPPVLWTLLVSDALAKVSVHECVRRIDVCRLERCFPSVPSIEIFRETLVQLTLASILQPSVVLIVLTMRSDSSLKTVAVTMWIVSQLILGAATLTSRVFLMLATAPPTS